MSALLLIILAIVIFVVAYLTYGRYLAKTWGLDPSKKTPAYELEDGVDYCPAKTPVLMGHHSRLPRPRFQDLKAEIATNLEPCHIA